MGNSKTLFEEIAQWYPALAYRWCPARTTVYVVHQIYFPELNIYLPFREGIITVKLLEKF